MLIKIEHPKQFTRQLIKALLKLTISGLIIGFVKTFDLIVAIFLLLKVIHKFYLNAKNNTKNTVLTIGMLSTGILGMIIEFWGTSNDFWTYHEIGNRQLPYWLPFAWMLAFNYLYKVELSLIATLASPNIRQKIALAFWISLTLPAIGEMITIALGVWTYHVPYQIFGVPLIAIPALAVLHLLVYYFLHLFCKKRKIEDPVFN